MKHYIITIIGGGHLGHVCAGFLSARKLPPPVEGAGEVEVRLLTRRPANWDPHLKVTDCEGKVFNGNLSLITSDPAEALRGADIVLLCLPGYSIREMLERVADYLEPHTAVGAIVASTGFFFHAFDVLKKTQPLFGFQRVPFIARTKEYGHSADLLGYKPSLSVAIEQAEDKETLCAALQGIFRCPVNLLESFYEVSLSNSNPLLHTSRLYSLWHNHSEGMVYDRNPLFYAEWTEEAASLYISMDNELQTLLRVLGVREGAIPDVLTYYESTDADSLTRKLRSIPAFQGILAPMKEADSQSQGQSQGQSHFVPDFSSRYFTEDFAYGLSFARNLCHENGVPCPTMDKVYEWGNAFL